MKRSRAHLNHFAETLKPYILPMALSVMVFSFSTLLFVYSYRDDMLVFASLRANPFAVNSLVSIGAKAGGPTEIFTEPALIEYLHAFYGGKGPGKADAAVVETLIRAGASVSTRSETGWTPLMLAAATGQLGAAQVLVKNGAEVDARAVGDTSEGMTALMAASMHGHAEVAQFLLEHGANVHLRSRSGFTSLLLASSRGHLGCVEALLDFGASVPVTTLQVAERNGHTEVVAKLKEFLKNPRGDGANRRPAKFPEE